MNAAQHITAALRGHWHGHYGLAFCPAHPNSRTPALSLANGEGGRLLVHCHAGCGFGAVLDALRGLGLIEGRGRCAPPASVDLARIKAADEAEAAKREAQAVTLWRQAMPIKGTAAEVYLRGRGITADLPDTLRFHPEAWHGPSARRLPAMVALVEGADRLAVHRTWLRPDGTGKAAIVPARMMLGATAGGAVQVAEGPGPLVVAEGIETALSLASGLQHGPATVRAALSASGMAAMRLPPAAGRLTIATDGDDAGHTAGHRLAERASAMGWTVSLLPAPQGRDWNDILCMKGARG